MDLIREVLDKRLLDRDDNIVGRVDGIIMTIEGGGQPRVTELSVGGPAVFARIGPWAVAVTKLFAGAWGPKRRSPVRIRWSDIDHFGRDIRLILNRDDTELMAWENWIDTHIIRKIPGSGSK